jgi:hypothetical protein
MTTQQLLKPRYEVIADYPFSPYKIGDEVIIIAKTNVVFFAKIGDVEHLSSIDLSVNYPALFRKKGWWEGLTIETMPKKIMHKTENMTTIYIIEKWNDRSFDNWMQTFKRDEECSYVPID